MADSTALSVFIGHDSREAVVSEVAAYSIKKRTHTAVNLTFLKHKELRKAGYFHRPWLTDSDGNNVDLIDNKPFSTEFSHTRFLIPSLMKYKGWALFADNDMLFLSDIKNLFALCDDRYAVMVVKHNHIVKADYEKMDGRKQQGYYRKNWSSFVLWNCAHPSNHKITKGYVNLSKGCDLHSFKWLSDDLIGNLPITYNYINGISPKMPASSGSRPDVIHYTEGGPWFKNYRNTPYAQLWLDEYEDWQRSLNESYVTDIPTLAYEKEEL